MVMLRSLLIRGGSLRALPRKRQMHFRTSPIDLAARFDALGNGVAEPCVVTVVFPGKRAKGQVTGVTGEGGRSDADTAAGGGGSQFKVRLCRHECHELKEPRPLCTLNPPTTGTPFNQEIFASFFLL